MMLEKDFESILCKYPELIEDDLVYIGRQIRVDGKIIDIVFEDRFKQKLIVELKVGAINRKHIGQVMEYEGSVLCEDEPTTRIMLVGNRVPPNLRKALDYHGIEWREISYAMLKDFVANKNDSFYQLFENDQLIIHENIKKDSIKKKKQVKHYLINADKDGLIGIKIYKGSSSTNKNVELTLKNNINFSEVGNIINISLRDKLEELRENDSPLYAWAALASIQKTISYGQKIVFVIVNTQEMYIFDYVDSFFDKSAEFHKKIAKWTGKGFEKVVFLRNRVVMDIDYDIINTILDLLNAEYQEAGFAGYKYSPIMKEEDLSKIITMINKKCVN